MQPRPLRELLALLILTLAPCAWADTPEEQCAHGKAQSCEALMKTAPDVSVLIPQCEGGQSLACFRLGNLYLGGMGIPEDLPRGHQFLARACTLGHAMGCGLNGFRLHEERGMQVVSQEAFDFLEKACALGAADSCKLRGEYAEQGEGFSKETYSQGLAQAAHWYELACEKGSNWGCWNLATLYQSGRGVKQSDSKAERYFERSCELNPDDGCMGIVRSYLDAKILWYKRKRARTLLLRSCQKGGEEACSLLLDRMTQWVPVRLAPRPNDPHPRLPGDEVYFRSDQQRQQAFISSVGAIAPHGEDLYLLSFRGPSSESGAPHLWELSVQGVLTELSLPEPADQDWRQLVTGADGTLWIASDQFLAWRDPEKGWQRMPWSQAPGSAQRLSQFMALPDGRMLAMLKPSTPPPPSPALSEAAQAAAQAKFYRDQLFRFTLAPTPQVEMLEIKVEDSSNPPAPSIWHQWEVVGGVSRSLHWRQLTFPQAEERVRQELGAEHVHLTPSAHATDEFMRRRSPQDEVKEGQLEGPIESRYGVSGEGSARFFHVTKVEPGSVRSLQEVAPRIEKLLRVGRKDYELVLVDRTREPKRWQQGDYDLAAQDSAMNLHPPPTQAVPLPDGFVVHGNDQRQLQGQQWLDDSPLMRTLGRWQIKQLTPWGDQLLLTLEDGSHRLVGVDGKEGARLSSLSRIYTLIPVSAERMRGIGGEGGMNGNTLYEFDRSGTIRSTWPLSSLPTSGFDCSQTVQAVARPGATWLLCEHQLARITPEGGTLYGADESKK